MSNMLALLQGQSEQIQRGENPIADFDYNAKQEELKRLFSKQDEALAAARAKIGREIGETQLQAIEQAVPGLYRGGKYLARRTGISDKIDQAKKAFDDFTTRTKGRISDYLDSLTPEGVTRFMENRAGVPRAEPQPEQDPRYQPPPKSEIQMTDIGEIAEPQPGQDPRYQPPPKSEIAEPNTPEIEGHLDTAVLNSMADRIRRLPDAGQEYFDRETTKYNLSKGIDNQGSPFREPGSDALPDPDLLQGHAKILEDAGRQFGYREGLPGGGRVSDLIGRFTGGKARPQPVEETQAPQEEDIARLYREAGVAPELNLGETAQQYQSRISRGGTIREAAATASAAGLPNELENPLEPPQQEYRGEIDPDRAPGGIIERGYQRLQAPTEEQNLAEVARQNELLRQRQLTERPEDFAPTITPRRPAPALPAESVPPAPPVPPEVQAYTEGTTTTTRVAPNIRSRGVYSQADIEGQQVGQPPRTALGMAGRAPAIAEEAAQRARVLAETQPSVNISDPVARATPSYGSVGNPLRGADAPPPPPRGYKGIYKAPEPDFFSDFDEKLAQKELIGPPRPAARPAARPVAAEPIATQTPPTVAPKPKTQGTPIETQTEPVQGKEQETQTEAPQEGSAEGSTSRFGGYGLEAGFGLAAIGELANPLSTPQDKMKEVAATGALYGATKVGESALKSAGLEAGLPEIMTGVEVGQDLLDKDKTDTQKAVAVGTAVGEYGGAMAAEALVPGLGEVAMIGTALGGLFEGLHKEHEEEDEQKQQAATIAAKQRAQQQQLESQRPAVAFDAAPVIDSSSYHNL